MVRRIDRDLRAHAPVGMGHRLLRRRAGHRLRGSSSRNGPPEAVRISRATPVARRPAAAPGRSPNARNRPGSPPPPAALAASQQRRAGADQAFLVGQARRSRRCARPPGSAPGPPSRRSPTSPSPRPGRPPRRWPHCPAAALDAGAVQAARAVRRSRLSSSITDQLRPPAPAPARPAARHCGPRSGRPPRPRPSRAPAPAPADRASRRRPSRSSPGRVTRRRQVNAPSRLVKHQPRGGEREGREHQAIDPVQQAAMAGDQVARSP